MFGTMQNQKQMKILHLLQNLVLDNITWISLCIYTFSKIGHMKYNGAMKEKSTLWKTSHTTIATLSECDPNMQNLMIPINQPTNQVQEMISHLNMGNCCNAFAFSLLHNNHFNS